MVTNRDLQVIPSDDASHGLINSKNIARVLNGAAIAASLWGWVLPRPNELVVPLLAAFPIFTIVLLLTGNGTYQIEGRKKDKRPTLTFALIAPGGVLALCAMQQAHLVRVTPVVAPAVIIGLLLTYFVAKGDAKLALQRWLLLVVLLFSSIYGYGLTAEANAMLDRSQAQNFEVTVVSKHTSGTKSRSYHLVLVPWGPVKELDNVTVSPGMYRAVQSGEKVCAHLHAGAFQMPWYSVGVCRETY